MRILHLISSLGLFGAEQVLLNLASGMKDAEAQVGVLHNAHNPHLEIFEEAKKRGLPVVCFRCGGRFDIRTVLEIRKYIRQNGVDVLHTHNYKADIFGFLATRFAGMRWVATNHLWHETDRKLMFYEWLDALAFRFADKITAVSPDIKDDLVRRGVRGNGIQVIANGIDVEKFSAAGGRRSAARAEFGFGEHDFVIGTIGRLSPEKGHAILLTAAREIVAGEENARFLIVGDGPLREGLEQESRRLGLGDKVVFGGVQKDMPKIYAAIDLLAMPSLAEGLPMTLLEAMAARVPAVLTEVGGIPDVISNGESGLLIPSGDAWALTEAILKLIGSSSLRQRLAEGAYKTVSQNYSTPRMAAEYRAVYADVIGLSGKSR